MVLGNVVTKNKDERGKWVSKVGLPSLDLDKMVSTTLPGGGEEDLAVRIEHQYRIRWGKRKWSADDQEDLSIDQARILSHGKKVDPDGWEVVGGQIEQRAEQILRQIDAHKPLVVLAGKPPEPDWLPYKYGHLAVQHGPTEGRKKILDAAVKKGIIPGGVASTLGTLLDHLEGEHTENAYVHEALKNTLRALIPPDPSEAEEGADGDSDDDDENPAERKRDAEARAKEEEAERKRKPGSRPKPPPKRTMSKAEEEELRRDYEKLLKSAKDWKEFKISHTGLFGQWGRMKTINAALKKALRPRTQRFRPGEAGVLQDAGRLLTDGLAFRDYRRKVKGSVLIDCSGSMSPSAEQIEEIVSLSSAAVVGLYGGASLGQTRHDSPANTYSGALVVVGRDGKVVSSIQDEMHAARFNGGNVVDGPALDWLMRQEAPRIWVSDGMVSGLDEDFAENLKTEVAMQCKWGGVTMVPSLTEAIPFFQRRR